MKKRLFLATAVTFVASGWSPEASAIIGGQLDPAPSSVVAISGELSNGSSGLVCTGTLIAPNVVLTARHCIEEGDPGCMSMFTGVAKYVRIGVTTDALIYEVASTRVPTSNLACGDDIALLVLASPVPSSDGSPSADVRLTKVVKDEPYSAVGFGRTCADQATPCSSSGQRHRKDGLSVECLDCRPRTWRGTSDSTCIGDSGGPAFDKDKRVLGVTSVGGLGCTTAYYTRLDIHADFLRDTVKAETTKAGLAAPAWTTASEADGGMGPTPGTDAGGPKSDAGDPGAAPAAGEEGCTIARARSRGAISSLILLALGASLVARRQRPRRLK